MAEVVDNLPNTANQNSGKGWRWQKYDWESWLDGQIWKLTPGEDFEARADTFRYAAYNYAKRNGIEIRTRIVNGHVYIQAIK